MHRRSLRQRRKLKVVMNTPKDVPLTQIEPKGFLFSSLADAVGARVTLCLDVDVGETGSIPIDDAIDPALVGLTHLEFATLLPQ